MGFLSGMTGTDLEEADGWLQVRTYTDEARKQAVLRASERTVSTVSS